MKKIILIGGAAGTGKSTLARQLAEHFSVPWISTDQVRRILRPTETNEIKKLAMVWEGTSALLHGIDPWEGGIIEGTAILPQFIDRDLKNVGRNIKPIFLIQNEEQITRTVFERSLLPYIKTKTPEQQAFKVKEIFASNNEIKKAAEDAHYPCIMGNSENTFRDALAVLEK